MRYQVEIDNEVVAVFRFVTWAEKWADEYATSVTDSYGNSPVTIVIVDGYDDVVMKSWG